MFKIKTWDLNTAGAIEHHKHFNQFLRENKSFRVMKTTLNLILRTQDDTVSRGLILANLDVVKKYSTSIYEEGMEVQ